MSRTWMPLYIGDYLRDTGHLTTEEHGAYFLLIMHYWQRGELPTDDAALARISRVSRHRWRSICLAIAPLFEDGWKHKRIEEELENDRIIKEKRALAGRKGGLANRGKTNLDRAILKAIAKQTVHHSHKKERKSLNGESGGHQGRGYRGEKTLADIVREKGWVQPSPPPPADTDAA